MFLIFLILCNCNLFKIKFPYHSKVDTNLEYSKKAKKLNLKYNIKVSKPEEVLDSYENKIDESLEKKFIKFEVGKEYKIYESKELYSCFLSFLSKKKFLELKLEDLENQVIKDNTPLGSKFEKELNRRLKEFMDCKEEIKEVDFMNVFSITWDEIFYRDFIENLDNKKVKVLKENRLIKIIYQIIKKTRNNGLQTINIDIAYLEKGILKNIQNHIQIKKNTIGITLYDEMKLYFEFFL